MKQSVGIVERHTEVVKLSAIVSLECSIFAAWSIETLQPLHESILKAILLLGHYRRHKSKLFNYSSQSRTQSEIHGRTLECSGPPPPAAGL